MTETTKEMQLIEWGIATKAIPGEVESGDQYLIEPFPNGVLIAVVDGLGHGEKASIVAKKAVAEMKSYSHEPVISLLRRCHVRLKGTRGVVMSLVSFNFHDGIVDWLGVGNVEGVLFRADKSSNERLMLRGGIVGYRLPSLHEATVPLKKGDTLILATDGLRSGFSEALTRTNSPQENADLIFSKYSRGTDDALVLVVRYRN